ncbi:hypothetical protein HHI36_012054 [Cryptolaemus montrouzieri]|uniref:Succinate dehydrogenase assembly factor 2, mitochondrial n=1 Tax=Cryptolaemus montrouzieri TaxID=559131 RepID=A0ABD2NDT5_9CUCU
MNFLRVINSSRRQLHMTTLKYFSSEMNNEIMSSPKYPDLIIAKPRRRSDESFKEKKARLVYQSRKRGMLENDLLLSTFAAKYLGQFNETQLAEYDRLINEPSNDWDIYKWAVGAIDIPKDYDSDVFQLFKKHVENSQKETRFKQPDLY